MQQYLQLLKKTKENGSFKDERTGVGTYSLFAQQLRFDLRRGFPLLTTKKLHIRSIIYELLWFLRGDTNVKYLQENKVRIWDEWADKDGNLGPVYGHQWRSWMGHDNKTIDQIANVINHIKTNPNSRRLIVSAWNVGDLEKMALPPCHLMFQFYVDDKKLSCQLYQRSADIFLGVPFNIASYSLLTCIIAQICNLEPFEFIHTFGDVHLYANHVEQANLQLSRQTGSLPLLQLNPNIRNIDDFTFNDIKFENYKAAANIKAPVAV